MCMVLYVATSTYHRVACYCSVDFFIVRSNVEAAYVSAFLVSPPLIRRASRMWVMASSFIPSRLRPRTLPSSNIKPRVTATMWRQVLDESKYTYKKR